MIDVEHRTFIPADGREVRVSIQQRARSAGVEEAREVVFETSAGEEVARVPLTGDKPLWGLTTEELQALYSSGTR